MRLESRNTINVLTADVIKALLWDRETRVEVASRGKSLVAIGRAGEGGEGELMWEEAGRHRVIVLVWIKSERPTTLATRGLRVGK